KKKITGSLENIFSRRHGIREFVHTWGERLLAGNVESLVTYVLTAAVRIKGFDFTRWSGLIESGWPTLQNLLQLCSRWSLQDQTLPFGSLTHLSFHWDEHSEVFEAQLCSIVRDTVTSVAITGRHGRGPGLDIDNWATYGFPGRLRRIHLQFD